MFVFRIVVDVIIMVFAGCVAFAIYLLDRFGTLDDDNVDNDKEKIIDD